MLASIPLSAFRVPDGKLAITFDLHGLQYWTAVVATTDVDVSLNAVEQSLELSEADRTSTAIHIRFRKVLRARWQDVEPEGKMAYVMLGIWLGVNNPADAVKPPAEKEQPLN